MQLGGVLEFLICLILAISGVAARTLRYTNIGDLQIAKLVSNMFVAAFGSAIVYVANKMVGLPVQTGYLLSALVGWGGPQIIDRIFEKNTDIKFDDNNSQKNTDNPQKGAGNPQESTGNPQENIDNPQENTDNPQENTDDKQEN